MNHAAKLGLRAQRKAQSPSDFSYTPNKCGNLLNPCVSQQCYLAIILRLSPPSFFPHHLPRRAIFPFYSFTARALLPLFHRLIVPLHYVPYPTQKLPLLFCSFRSSGGTEGNSLLRGAASAMLSGK